LPLRRTGARADGHDLDDTRDFAPFASFA
jgi:hypothetical protein